MITVQSLDLARSMPYTIGSSVLILPMHLAMYAMPNYDTFDYLFLCK